MSRQARVLGWLARGMALSATAAVIACGAAPGDATSVDPSLHTRQAVTACLEMARVGGAAQCCNGSATVQAEVVAAYPDLIAACGPNGPDTWEAFVTPDGLGLEFSGPAIDDPACAEAIATYVGTPTSSTSVCGGGGGVIVIAICSGYPGGGGCGSCGHSGG